MAISDATLLSLGMAALATIPVIWGLVRASKNDKQAIKDKAEDKNIAWRDAFIDQQQEEIDRKQEEITRLRALLAEKNGATKTSHAPASPGARKS